MAGKPNKEEIFDLIQSHPEGLDDDDISEMTGIEPRQQVQQLCNQLASVRRIRRESTDKAGKRRLEARRKFQLPDFDFSAEIREPFAFAETRSFFNVFSRSRTVPLMGCNRTLFSLTSRLVLPDLIWDIIVSKSLFAAFAKACAI